MSTGTGKGRISVVTKCWKDEMNDHLLIRIVMETIARVKKNDSDREDGCTHR